MDTRQEIAMIAFNVQVASAEKATTVTRKRMLASPTTSALWKNLSVPRENCTSLVDTPKMNNANSTVEITTPKNANPDATASMVM